LIPQLERNNKKQKVEVISSGRLVKEKSFEVFLNAVSKLKNNVKVKADFYISGTGNHLNELLKLKNKLKIDIDFKGVVNDIEELFESTHIFVMSTGNPDEGLGLGLIQAALKKNLIITPGYHSIKELLTHEKDGFIFNMGDSGELAKMLNYVIENYAGVKTLAENFYLKVIKEFSAKKNGEIFNNLYKNLYE
jgi:glycosyltransferase involved in cell wall biosynthesis